MMDIWAILRVDIEFYIFGAMLWSVPCPFGSPEMFAVARSPYVIPRYL